jgi:hypothetical protein
MEREKEIGKVSGFVNKQNMHTLGSRIVLFKEYLEKANGQHLKRFGKPINMNKCKCDNGALGIDCNK